MKKFLYKDLYDQEETHWWHQAKRKTVLQLILKYSYKKSPKILDLGCGTGKNIEFLSTLGEVWGVDSSSKAISFCKKRGLKRIKKTLAEKTSFTKGSFDIITMLDVLEHVDEKSALKEVKRILKKNGLLIITVPAYQFLWSKWDEILHHKKRYNKKQLTNVLKENEFKVEKISYLYTFLFIPLLIIRPIKSLLNNNNYSSDFEINNKFINIIATLLSSAERKILNNHSLPFGLTIVSVVRSI